MAEWLAIDSWVYSYVIIPFLIFIARISDQSIGTLRLIFISKGYKNLAPFIGFFEVIIWILAIRQIFQHLDNWVCYIAYGAGFATGNYIGILLDERLSLGNVLIRVIPRFDTTNLIKDLSDHGFGITVMDADGKNGPVKIILTIIQRKEIPAVVEIINKHNPNAFYTIEEVKAVNRGVFRQENPSGLFKQLIWGPKKLK
ncbi:MAG: DUF2179 domain-containing protein [Bacteroidales bacterium]